MLTVKMVDGSPLPAWMKFDPVKKVVSGTPPHGVKGEFKVIVLANDQFGGEARSEMSIKVGR
jgi:Putative Ig domain